MQKLKTYLLWLRESTRGYKGAIAGNIILGMFAVGLNLGFIALSKSLIDLATSEAASPEKTHDLIVLSAGLIAVMLIRVITNAFRVKLETNSSFRMVFSTRRSMFQSLMFSVWKGRSSMHTGDETNRLFSDVDKVSKVTCQELPSLCVTLFQLVAAFVFLSTMNLTLALVLLCITPVFVAFSKIFIKKLRALTKGIRDAESGIQSHIQESLQHKVVLQSMEQDSAAIELLQDLQYGEYAQVLRRTRFNTWSRGVMGLAFGAGYATALLCGVFGIANGTITFGVMTAFLQLVGQIQGPAVQITRQIPTIVYASNSLDRILEISATEAEQRNKAIAVPAPAGVRVTGLTFRYPDGTSDILSDFSHDFTPGSRTAIVGETGAGKSTLIRLMLGLLKAREGEIQLYSEKSGPVPVSADTRCNFVYVPQGNSLFSGTIRDNLLMGDAEASDEKMWKALETACADGFVRELPDGLDSRCGEQGGGLSEGQAQRIAIARALLRPGSILLLDEFSSSLDPDTERQLLKNLASGQSDKTMVFITHREIVAEYCGETVRIG